MSTEKEVSKDLNKKKFYKIKKENVIGYSVSYKIFSAFNYTFLILLALLCLFPLIQVFAVSLSHGYAISAGKVLLWPINAARVNDVTVFYPWQINGEAYWYIINNINFWRSFLVAIERLVVGTAINMFLVVIISYPLSQDPRKFPMRLIYVWFFFFATLFSGGLIPSYLIVVKTGMIDTFWSMIIPGAVHVGSIILLLNFFRQLPKELDEAAFMDGAGHWTILFKIYIPTSLAALATITLFTLVGHWNEWFSPIIYINDPQKWPLATYLQSVIIKNDMQTSKSPGPDQPGGTGIVNKENLIAAQIFVGAVPILMIYPFLQKYFAKGIVLGSVKG